MTAPLRAIIETMPGAPAEFDLEGLGKVSLRTVVHKLECGHITEPYIRDGCRVPKLPKRRRCKQCLSQESEQAGSPIDEGADCAG